MEVFVNKVPLYTSNFLGAKKLGARITYLDSPNIGGIDVGCRCFSLFLASRGPFQSAQHAFRFWVGRDVKYNHDHEKTQAAS